MFRTYTPLRFSDAVRIEPEKFSRHVSHFFPDLNLLFSAIYFRKSRKVENLCKKFGSFKRYLGLKGELMSDSGAFTCYRKDLPPFLPEQLAEIYQLIGGRYVFHNDIPVVFLLKSKRTIEKGIFGTGTFGRTELVNSLLEKNLVMAQECDKALQHLADIQLVPVAQGLVPDQYVQQVRSLAGMGFSYVAVGGLAFRPVREVVEILARVTDVARSKDILLHILGIGRLWLLEPYLHSVIVSNDANTPVDDALRDSSGRSSFFYSLEGGELRKNRINELLSGEIDFPRCSCSLCEIYGRKIIFFGDNSRNKARAFHNIHIFQRFVAEKYGK